VTQYEGNTTSLSLQDDKWYLEKEEEKKAVKISTVSALDYVTAFDAFEYFRKLPSGEFTEQDTGTNQPRFVAELYANDGTKIMEVKFGGLINDKVFMQSGEDFYFIKLDVWKDLLNAFRKLGR
jgi:hypothetical protein